MKRLLLKLIARLLLGMGNKNDYAALVKVGGTPYMMTIEPFRTPDEIIAEGKRMLLAVAEQAARQKG